MEEPQRAHPSILTGFLSNQWPLEKRYKHTIEGLKPWRILIWRLLENIGFEPIEAPLREMGRILAEATVLNTLERLGVRGRNAMTAASFFMLADEIVWDIPMEVLEWTPERAVVRLGLSPNGGCVVWDPDETCRPEDAPCGPEVCVAYTEFERTAAKLIHPKMKYTNRHQVTKGDNYPGYSCEIWFELEGAESTSEEKDLNKQIQTDRTGLQLGIDWNAWPLERMYKAGCRWSAMFYGVFVWTLIKSLGLDRIKKSVVEGRELLARKQVPVFLKDIYINSNNAMGCATYVLKTEQIFHNWPMEVVEMTSKKAVIRKLALPNGGCAVFDPRCTPLPTEIPNGPEFCDLNCAFEREVCRLINPHVKCSLVKRMTAGDPYCEFAFELQEPSINY